MEEPKLSVCIPVFNGEGYIKAAVESVLTQSYTDFELLIVDNCSTDSTVKIVQSFSDRRIRLIQNVSNIGMVPNWNTAMQHARGRYIKILPADDLLLPGCLHSQVIALEADKKEEISIVCGKRQIISGSGKRLFTRGYSWRSGRFSGTAAINKVIRSGGNLIGEGGAVMFRKSILQKTGYFSDAIFYVLDIDLWFRMLLHGDLFFQNRIVAAFRVSGSSASVQVVNRQRDDYSRFIKKIYSQKEFGLTRYSVGTGFLFTYLLTGMKKVIYRFVA